MLYKSCREVDQKSIVPTHLPYVVSLVRFYETDSAIYLQLQHAAGGRLWSYVSAYLNQCADVIANAYGNIEPHRPACDRTGAKVDRVKNNYVSSDTSQKSTGQDVSPSPASTDDNIALTSTVYSELGEQDTKSKLSSDLESVDESHETVDRKVSVASSSWSQGFGEVLQSANPEMKYFRIDSSDSSSHTSRQVSCSSAEDSFCRVHCTVMLSGVCRFCSESETPRPAPCSNNGTGSPDETSIYDACHDETVDTNEQTQDVGSTCNADCELTGEATDRGLRVEVDRSRYSVIRPNSQERSFDSCDRRRRRRTLSSAFGELDLAESTAASVAAPLRPLVHLPESCVRQWAAEMVVAISRLHSIGIVCRQVNSHSFAYNVFFKPVYHVRIFNTLSK